MTKVTRITSPQVSEVMPSGPNAVEQSHIRYKMERRLEIYDSLKRENLRLPGRRASAPDSKAP